MPRRTTIGRLASDLGLRVDELASVLAAVQGVTVRTKLRRLDLMQTDAFARAVRNLT